MSGQFCYLYLSDLGYVVYRHSFDERRCSIAAGARAHKVAVFVEEIEAQRFCEFRNRYATEGIR